MFVKIFNWVSFCFWFLVNNWLLFRFCFFCRSFFWRRHCHNFFDIDFTGYTWNCDWPVFKNLWMNFTKYTNLFSVNHDCSLTTRNESWIITFSNFVLMIKEVQERRNFAGSTVKVSIASSSHKAKTLTSSCSCIFLLAKVSNFSDFENFVRENCVSRSAFCSEQRSDDRRANELIVFAHWIWNFDDFWIVDIHFFDIVFFASKVIEDHFLISKTYHDVLCLSWEQCQRHQTTDCKVIWFFSIEVIKPNTDHYIFNNINFVKEVVSEWCRPYCKFNITIYISCFNFVAHSYKSFNNLFFCKWRTKKLVDILKNSFCRLLEIEWSTDWFSKSCFIWMFNFNRTDCITTVSKVTGNNVCSKHQVCHVVTSKFYHQVFVSNLNSAQSCTVDNWCHRHYFVIIIC